MIGCGASKEKAALNEGIVAVCEKDKPLEVMRCCSSWLPHLYEVSVYEPTS